MASSWTCLNAGPSEVGGGADSWFATHVDWRLTEMGEGRSTLTPLKDLQVKLGSGSSFGMMDDLRHGFMYPTPTQVFLTARQGVTSQTTQLCSAPPTAGSVKQCLYEGRGRIFLKGSSSISQECKQRRKITACLLHPALPPPCAQRRLVGSAVWAVTAIMCEPTLWPGRLCIGHGREAERSGNR